MMRRLSPILRVPHSSHSRATGASVIRGTERAVDGVVVSPTAASSLTPYGHEAAQPTICWAMDSSGRWTTNSFVRRMFFAVSLGIPGSRSPGANPMIGGLAPKTLKNENGAAFIDLSSFNVVTSAIGRGVTIPERIL